MSWERVKAVIQYGTRWFCNQALKGLRWLGVKLHIISPPMVIPANVAAATAGSALFHAIHSRQYDGSPAQTQVITWPEDDEKKITGTRAFPLKSSGRILIRHDTQLVFPPGMFNLKETGSYFFSVYDPRSQRHEWLKGEYKRSDVPRCYLPTGPILKPLQDEICFLDRKDEFRSLVLVQGDDFFNTNNLSRGLVGNLPCALLGSNEYVFLRQERGPGLHARIVHCQQEQENIRILNTKECPREILNSTSSLTITASPGLVCTSTFTTVSLFQLEEKQGLVPQGSFKISHIAGKDSRQFNFRMINAISNHEIIAFANGRSGPALNMQVLLKIDLESKQVHELQFSRRPGNLFQIYTLSLSPSLFLLVEYWGGYQSFFIIDPEEMILESLQIPQHCELQGIMPDGSLLLKKYNIDKQEYMLYAHPAIQYILALKKETIRKKLTSEIPMPLPLSNLISDYVGEDVDVAIRLSSHFASFYGGRERSEIGSYALEEAKPSNQFSF